MFFTSFTGILIPNIILIIHIININTAIGITQVVINNVAIASIKLLNIVFPFSTNSEIPFPRLDIALVTAEEILFQIPSFLFSSSFVVSTSSPKLLASSIV